MWIAVVGELCHIEIFTLAQMKVWSWVMSKAHGVSFSYSNWCVKPLICMMSVNFFRR